MDRQRLRRRTIARMILIEGWSTKEVCLYLDIDHTTVERVIANAKSVENPKRSLRPSRQDAEECSSSDLIRWRT